MVPTKERILIKRITSKKALLLIRTEKTAVAEIILMPSISRAWIRSGREGPGLDEIWWLRLKIQ